jgi:hypothetical protein
MWPCKKCLVEVEDTFKACWKCGTSSEGVEDPAFSTNTVMDRDAPEGLVEVGLKGQPGLPRPGGLARSPAKSTCAHCGSPHLVLGVKTGLSAEVGSIGLQYRGFVFRGTQPIYADLCKSCGTIVRFHVDNTDRQWVTK